MSWFSKNAHSIEAAAALLTAAVAVAALVGVKLQIDATAAQQAQQSARDIYREHLTLSVANPDYAAPDVCALMSSDRAPAYEAYVEHLLYTAEQILDTQKDWADTLSDRLAPHTDYFCSSPDWPGYTDAVAALIAATRAQNCTAEPPCT